MFAKIFAFFAIIAVAFAAPNPKPDPAPAPKPEPAPAPQYLAYSAGLDYVYPPGAAVIPNVVSPYASLPLTYSAFPANTVYLR